MEEEEIHYGACVTLSLESDDLLNSRGFTDTSVYTDRFSQELDSSAAVFRILPSCTYAVQREVLAALNQTTVPSTDHLSLLEENLEGEMKTNMKTYAAYKGKTLKYGAWVQFEHLASRKYLTLRPLESAEIEREHLRVCLEDFSSDQALFRLEPAFQFQSDQPVLSGNLVILSIFVSQFTRTAYLHSGISSHDRALLTYGVHAFTQNRRLSISQEKYEVNASLESPTLWKMKLFCPFVAEDSEQVMVGDSVWLLNSELDYCVMGHEDGVLAGSNGDTNGLWLIERSDEKEGGFAKIDLAYRLRHISSGLYLSANAGGKDKINPFGVAKAIAESIIYDESGLILAEKSSHSLWSFETVPSRKPTQYVLKDEFFRVKNSSNGRYLHLRKTEEGLEYALTSEASDTSVFKVLKCDEALILELRFLISSLSLLRYFPDLLTQQAETEKNLKEYREFKRYLGIISKTVTDLQKFCDNRLPHLVAFTKKYGQMEALRQKLLREQKCLEAVAALLSAFTGQFDVSQKTMCEYDLNKQRDLLELAEMLYALVISICKDNLANQKYAQKFLELYQLQAPYLANCVSAMITIISGSEELLLQAHKTMTHTVLPHFAQFLRQPETRSPQILRFLRALCRFKASGLSANQEKVHEVVFAESNALVQTAL